MTLSKDELARLGEHLLELASPEQIAAARAILARVHERRLRVLVAGEAKRGKSTLLNRLLERELLPTGALPVTAVSTTVRYGEHDELRVFYLDGREAVRPLDDLAQFVTERANPENALGIADVEAVLAGGRLAPYRVELVDTPGTGSVFEHNTQTARNAYASLDAVIMVLTASPPMNAAERALRREVSRDAVRTFIVINKVDQLAPSEIDETIQFTASLCAQIGVPTGDLSTMSARDGDGGFVQFRTSFESYLDARGESDAQRALAGHAMRIARRMRDEAAIELRAIEMARGDTLAQLAAFAAHVDVLARQAGDLADRCRASERRLRRELDDRAHAFGVDVAQSCLAELRATKIDLAGASPADIERQGKQAVEHIVTEAV